MSSFRIDSAWSRRVVPHLPALAAVVIFFAAILPASPVAVKARGLAIAANSPIFSYALTATSNPVIPGHAAVFTLTLTNLTNASQVSDICHLVPEFTQQGGFPAGTNLCTGNFAVPAGTSTSSIIDLTVLSGASTPPDGSPITLTMTDTLNSASVSRTLTVQSVLTAGLALSTPGGTVVPGGSFTNTLTFSNYSANTLSGLQLSAPVPAGASFVAADRGGVLGDDGVVRWSLPPLAVGATSMVHLTLQASPISPATAGFIVLDATLDDSSNALLAEANGALPVYPAPVLSYALATTLNPVGPGHAAVFTYTVTNPTNASQVSNLCHIVPEFTQQGGFTAGTNLCTGNFAVPAGKSTSGVIDLTVLSGASTPPNGALVNLIITDTLDGASISRNETVQSTPEAGLAISTPSGTVVPGGSFTDTLTYSNYTAATLSGLLLSLPVPAGASFVAADGGGVLGADGVVRWSPLPPLAVGATSMVHLTLQAAAISPATAAFLVVDATLNDSSNNFLAEANGALPVYPVPLLSYALTTLSNPVVSGHAAVFTYTVTNPTNASQVSNLCHIVPEFTQQGGFTAGTNLCTGNFAVAAGTSTSGVINLTVLSGASTPPDGSLINLIIIDTLDAASISRNATVQSTPDVGLALSSTLNGAVVPGGSFTDTLTYSNYSGVTLSGMQLSVPLPAGASFVAADGGGVLGGDGVVRWSLPPLPVGATSMVHLTLQASPISPATAGLLVLDATLNDSSNNLLVEASDTVTVDPTPLLSYALTTMSNPAIPGHAAVFTYTVTNPTNAAQVADICHIVPEFTQQGGFTAGTNLCTGNFSVPAGSSTSGIIDLTVLNGASTPPDGSLINLTILDTLDGASVSRNATVLSVPEVGFALSTADGSVVPAVPFTYTLTFSNYSDGTLSGMQLSARVPAGASFVSADSGGELVGDVVQWSLPPLAAGATGMVLLTLQAATISPATAGLLVVDATLDDSSNNLLAEDSSPMTVYAAPIFSYALTPPPSEVGPGQTETFTWMVTNLTNAAQVTDLCHVVPEFTQQGGFTAGTQICTGNFQVSVGTPASGTIPLTVLNGVSTPPHGALIDLTITDTLNGASVSSNIGVAPSQVATPTATRTATATPTATATSATPTATATATSTPTTTATPTATATSTSSTTATATATATGTPTTTATPTATATTTVTATSTATATTTATATPTATPTATATSTSSTTATATATGTGTPTTTATQTATPTATASPTATATTTVTATTTPTPTATATSSSSTTATPTITATSTATASPTATATTTVTATTTPTPTATATSSSSTTATPTITATSTATASPTATATTTVTATPTATPTPTATATSSSSTTATPTITATQTATATATPTATPTATRTATSTATATSTTTATATATATVTATLTATATGTATLVATITATPSTTTTPSSTPTAVATASPPMNLKASPGSTVSAGTLMVANNSGAPMVTSQVTITFDNADLFSSATVTATVGDATSTATVVPVTGGDSPEQPNLTVFNLAPPLVVPAGESATINLSVVVSNTPHVTMLRRPMMYASMVPGGGLRGWGSGLLASMLLLSVGTVLVTSSRPRRMYFVLVIALLAMTSQVGCDNGSIGSPSGGSSGSSSSVPRVSNQNARGVTANNQNTGDKITVSGFPPSGIPLSTISVP